MSCLPIVDFRGATQSIHLVEEDVNGMLDMPPATPLLECRHFHGASWAFPTNDKCSLNYFALDSNSLDNPDKR